MQGLRLQRNHSINQGEARDWQACAHFHARAAGEEVLPETGELAEGEFHHFLADAIEDN